MIYYGDALMGRLPYGFSTAAIVSFVISLVLCTLLIHSAAKNRSNIEKLEIEHLILEKSIQIHEEFTELLYKAQALSMIVVQRDGEVDIFDEVAPSILKNDPKILNVLLAPDGIVSKIYPLRGNESVIGWNFFSEGPGNKEARSAAEEGHLVLAGPFDMATDAQAITGSMPVYIDTSAEKQHFWGLVLLTLKFPQCLENVEFDILERRGYAYELWRINPDTEQRQVIAHSDYYGEPTPKYIEKKIHIYNADWHLKVWPAHAWYSYTENMILVFASFIVCFIVLFIMQNNFELRKMKTFFEEMAKVDPVTGIYNRRYIDETLRGIIKSLSRSNGDLSLLMIDVDHFKSYNDTYGHSKGDTCLRNIAEVIKKNLLRDGDFVVRYGGEEFVVVLPNTSESGARKVSERLLTAMRERNIPHEASLVASYVTFSVGATTATVHHTFSGDDYIKRADQAMYMSKQSGRNRYTFLELM
jgi:diguanylate cyclase (GGDEF)-like protein